MGKTIIHNDDTFAKLWRSELTVEQISEVYGVAKTSISNAAGRFGYPARDKRYRNGRARTIREVPMAEPEARRRCPIVEGPRFWTRHHDQRVWETDGRYVEINALADEWGVAANRITARWHLLRAA